MILQAATEKTWLDYLTAFGAVATPLLVLTLTGVGWRLRTRFERQAALEDKLREDRIGTYNAILKPFIILLTSDAAWQSDPKNKSKDKDEIAKRTLLSLEYREQGFRLSLVAPDPVVKSYNNLMQFFFGLEESSAPTNANVIVMLGLLGQFLLEIRRSMGNEATKVSNWEMLEWFMKDARKYRIGDTPKAIRTKLNATAEVQPDDPDRLTPSPPVT
jgi:hypothetical protein